jgi:hypothetical protein
VGPDRCPAAHRQDTHPLGCHRRRIPDRIIFDKLIQVLVFGCGYRRIADQGCSATTLRRRRDEWITTGLADQLRRAVLVADDRMLGLELEHLAVDGCITRRPAAARLPGPARWTAASKGCRRSVAVQAGGIPLAVVPAQPTTTGDGLLAATLDAAATLTAATVGPPPGTLTVHLDAGYDWQPCRQILAERGWWARSLPVGCRRRSRWADAG